MRIFNFRVLVIAVLAWVLLTPSFTIAVDLNQSTDASPSATMSFIQYDLAFPGILPDHPFYKLKVLRDKVVAFFTRDANKKALLYLKLADKGILASAMLVDKGNIDLSAETALKAEHNMTLITTYLPWTSRQKDPSLLTTLKLASTKHQEVLKSLVARVPPEKQQTYQTVLEFSSRNLETIQRFESEAK